MPSVRSPSNTLPVLYAAALLVSVFLIVPARFGGATFLAVYTGIVDAHSSSVNERSTHGDPLTLEELSRLQPGDIIMRRGDGPLSTVIVNLLGDSTGLSHSGVLVRASDREWHVIHSISSSISETGRDGVQIEPLERFVQQSVGGTTIVTRLRANTDTRLSMEEKARHYLEQQIPFDTGFRRGTENGLYCSELIARILPDSVRKQEGVLVEHRGIIGFESFLQTRWFEVVVDLRR